MPADPFDVKKYRACPAGCWRVCRSGAAVIRNAGLGEFLRSRRARLDPAQAGLTSAAGRRVPGLPREELTRLARCASPGLRQGIYGQDSAIRASTGNAHMIIGASRLL